MRCLCNPVQISLKEMCELQRSLGLTRIIECLPFHMRALSDVVIWSISGPCIRHVRGGSRIFEGGGVHARTQDFLKGGGGGDDIHKHPPLGHCPRDVIHFAWVFSIGTSSKGGGGGWGDHPCHPPWIRHALGSILGLQAKKRGGGSKRGSNFGPNVKKPTSWPKRGGPDPLERETQ